ncbi:hypothetical protein Trydic_g23230 [Trypoxylus dichotomus]
MANVDFAHDEIDRELLDSSQIKEYFEDATVFITGGTGFLGKLILEKLLRSFPELRRIYLLVRPKQGQSVMRRVETLLGDSLFNQIRNINPNFTEKVFYIRGECSRRDLGLNMNDKQMLIDEINCIFHCAGLMNFDEKLRSAAYVNVRATRDLLKMAKSMKNLKSFIYVSSVFAHCSRKNINEEFYRPSINSHELLTIVDAYDDGTLNKLSPIVLGHYENTFCFTKSIAEDVVRAEGVGLPLAIIRPSFIIATSQEPFPGWIENLYGPTGLLVAVNLGLARSTLADPKLTVDVIPADYVVSLSIAASWNIASLQALNENQELVERRRTNEDEIPIYNAVSSPENPLTWEKYISLSTKYSSRMPSMLLVSHSSNKINSNKYIHYLYVVLLHYIPALFIDLATFLMGKRPLLIRTYRKIDEFTETFKHFTLTRWYFKNSNTQELWKKLNATDRQLFEFDMSALNWQTYYFVYMRGIRVISFAREEPPIRNSVLYPTIIT